jgi:hypothetical protein
MRTLMGRKRKRERREDNRVVLLLLVYLKVMHRRARLHVVESVVKDTVVTIKFGGRISR